MTAATETNANQCTGLMKPHFNGRSAQLISSFVSDRKSQFQENNCGTWFDHVPYLIKRRSRMAAVKFIQGRLRKLLAVLVRSPLSLSHFWCVDGPFHS